MEELVLHALPQGVGAVPCGVGGGPQRTQDADRNDQSGDEERQEHDDDHHLSVVDGLQEHGVSKAVFWLDAPVSNSGRLKTLLAETAEKLRFAADIQMVKDADFELKKRANVISGDSAVITECISWYNLYEDLIGNRENTWITEFQL